MTDLLSILSQNPELAKYIKIEATASDLIAFGDMIVQKAIREIQRHSSVEPEEYLTPAQFAEALQISLVTLWSWDKKKITIPLYIGNQKRYRRSDLEKILNNK
jgi:hypothetical protein